MFLLCVLYSKPEGPCQLSAFIWTKQPSQNAVDAASSKRKDWPLGPPSERPTDWPHARMRNPSRPINDLRTPVEVVIPQPNRWPVPSKICFSALEPWQQGAFLHRYSQEGDHILLDLEPVPGPPLLSQVTSIIPIQLRRRVTFVGSPDDVKSGPVLWQSVFEWEKVTAELLENCSSPHPDLVSPLSSTLAFSPLLVPTTFPEPEINQKMVIRAEDGKYDAVQR